MSESVYQADLVSPWRSADHSMMCEAHPGREWPHEDCPGPGMPWIIEGRTLIEEILRLRGPAAVSPSADDEPLHTGDDDRLDALTSIRAGAEELSGGCSAEDATEAIEGILADCDTLDALILATIKRERESGPAAVSEAPLKTLLASMNEWLGNEEGLMIEDVVAWRDQLAAAMGKPKRGADPGVRPDAPEGT